MFSADDAKVALTIFNLLRTTTNQQIVKDFLKSRNIPVSAANWDDIYSRRVEPALVEEKISVHDLRNLLRDVEEHGRQHIFLYRCTDARAKAILEKKRLHALLDENNLKNLLSTPLDLDMPAEPVVVEIRETSPNAINKHKTLLIKQVEKRITRVYQGEVTNQLAKTISKVYKFEEKRAVNVVRLDESGLLELRIASRDNSTNYQENIDRLFGAISKIIPFAGFSPLSLDKAKNKLIKDMNDLSEEVRYVKSTARNDFGVVMDLSCATQNDNICEDDGSTAALEKFLENDAQISGTNIYLKIIDGSDDPKELHVTISGASNEFAIPVSCSTEDYEYVCRKILTLNA